MIYRGVTLAFVFFCLVSSTNAQTIRQTEREILFTSTTETVHRGVRYRHRTHYRSYSRYSRVTYNRGPTTIVGGRPPGCPGLFCGCALSLKIFGKIIPRLNLAGNWLSFPRTSPVPGAVAANRRHVFQLLSHVEGNIWQVWDANSGGRLTRIHNRSIAGYTTVMPKI